jgi:hypothetical protein
MRFRNRIFVLPLLVSLLSSLIVTDAAALEKTAVRVDDLERPDSWCAATTCTIMYYNICTDWAWAWGGWSPNAVLGVCYETCCSGPGISGSVLSTQEYLFYGAPCGRGFTGTIDIWTADENCCPATLLASQPYDFFAGWNTRSWELAGVPAEFLVTITLGPGYASPVTFASDHPAAGPTGPQACGTCYQLNRLSHSYDFGTATTLLCPGEKLNDGVCDVEWLWDVTMACEVSVETSSWARTKALYR